MARRGTISGAKAAAFSFRYRNENRHPVVVLLGIAEDTGAMGRVRNALIHQFKLSPPPADLIVSNQPAVMMPHLDAETAIRYKCLIDGLGGISRIEPMPIRNSPPLTPEFGDRRKGIRRQQNERRKSLRSHAYQPDRRSGRERRAKD